MNLFVLDRNPRLAARAHFGEAYYSDVRNCFDVRGQRVYHPTH